MGQCWGSQGSVLHSIKDGRDQSGQGTRRRRLRNLKDFGKKQVDVPDAVPRAGAEEST